MIEIRYFARFREELASEGERFESVDVDNVAALLARLRARDGVWARLFAADQRVMVAVNQELADPATPVRDGDEVAFFPPVTGG